MNTLSEILSTNTDLLWAAIISAIVSATVSYWFKRHETRHAAEVEYEYDQRKKLRELIGRHHGRLLSAANSMNYRMLNLYANHHKGWLDVCGDFSSPDLYYFRSSVYRFLNVCALVRLLETEAVLLDRRIAEKKDFLFLDYSAALQWVMTDVALTRGLPYDDFHQTDHFFADHFRQYCDCCIEDGKFITIEKFSDLLKTGKDSPIAPVLEFFDGVSANESRLRWDRLVAFHLLIMAFINTFGYTRQRSADDDFAWAAGQIRHPIVLENLIEWLPRHDLARASEIKRIVRAARRIDLANVNQRNEGELG